MNKRKKSLLYCNSRGIISCLAIYFSIYHAVTSAGGFKKIRWQVQPHNETPPFFMFVQCMQCTLKRSDVAHSHLVLIFRDTPAFHRFPCLWKKQPGPNFLCHPVERKFFLWNIFNVGFTFQERCVSQFKSAEFVI